MMDIRAILRARLDAAVGGEQVLSDPAAIEPYVSDWRGRYHGRALAVVRPGTTEQVAAVVRACADLGVPIVPQGGNTGQCGGATPDDRGNAIVLSLARMNRVRAVDPANATLTVEAGMPLATVQQAAADAGLMFPLSLAAEGSCSIGGNLSTNAGGTGVLRYGNTRDLVLGLEVVLPDGRVWEGLRGLRKDNTGYDLKHLFIGAEGTLGIITAAVVKLFPKPRSRATALVALDDPRSAVTLLTWLREACGDRVTAFELMSRLCIDLVVRHIPGQRDPFSEPHPWYVLVELSDSTEGEATTALLESALGAAAAREELRDAVIAASEAQRTALWQLRENIPESQKVDGVSIKHDVSVPVSRVPEMIAQASAQLAERFPDVRILAFGHVGDGNVHYNCSKAAEQDARAFFAQSHEVNTIVYDVVAALGGSISAEHGLGVLKRDEIKRYKSELELDLMRTVKRALDPNGIMNPGKVL